MINALSIERINSVEPVMVNKGCEVVCSLIGLKLTNTIQIIHFTRRASKMRMVLQILQP